jgi:hypothetical protein
VLLLLLLLQLVPPLLPLLLQAPASCAAACAPHHLHCLHMLLQRPPLCVPDPPAAAATLAPAALRHGCLALLAHVVAAAPRLCRLTA